MNVNYEKHKYSDEPIIDLSIWTHAYQWFSEKQHKIRKSRSKRKYEGQNKAN